jgi:NAD(P)H-hydrate epimerase
MAEVDRVATEEVGLHLLSMMENAGRTLAVEVRERTPPGESITVFAGAGGNGGGGLVAAKHLANAGRDVRVVLDRDPDEYEGVPARQLGVLDATAVVVSTEIETSESDDEPSISGGTAVDALVGYGLQSAARGRVAELIEATEAFERVVSLDVPSGLDATTGERPGVAVTPDAVVTLALPKPGLAAVHDREGDPADLLLADIGIPAGVYDRAGIAYEDPFGGRDRVPLVVGV